MFYMVYKNVSCRDISVVEDTWAIQEQEIVYGYADNATVPEHKEQLKKNIFHIITRDCISELSFNAKFNHACTVPWICQFAAFEKGYVFFISVVFLQFEGESCRKNSVSDSVVTFKLYRYNMEWATFKLKESAVGYLSCGA